MKAVTSGNFLKEFTVIADCACDKKERFVVQRSNGKNVVLMSMEDFNGLRKELYCAKDGHC